MTCGQTVMLVRSAPRTLQMALLHWRRVVSEHGPSSGQTMCSSRAESRGTISRDARRLRPMPSISHRPSPTAHLDLGLCTHHPLTHLSTHLAYPGSYQDTLAVARMLPFPAVRRVALCDLACG